MMEVLPDLNLLEKIEAMKLWTKPVMIRSKEDKKRLDFLFKKGYSSIHKTTQ